MKSSYSFEDRGTDRQAESISERALKDLSNDIARKTIYLPRYIGGGEA